MNTRKHRLIELMFLLGLVSYGKYNYTAQMLGVHDIYVPMV